MRGKGTRWATLGPFLHGLHGGTQRGRRDEERDGRCVEEKLDLHRRTLPNTGAEFGHSGSIRSESVTLPESAI
ncbi:hypothetical protein L226DRAFT_535160 [Lentinus tigrinus ALCF2SS1-7]|uniref:uncharacterized protein n=1 Tax=Lentinus tigrinus ALCF2SS1-7 TaxID=1328758 RepID=UPI0011660AE8|nr:hypothetical protein L226DRAFT_535160 [Lentinus tigrinus ALCF2SS1-7]